MIADMTVNLRAVMATGHHSAREYVITGTWAANGKPISLPGVSVLEFDDDSITRNTDYYDLSTLMEQIAD
jgi:ketosteroid isomerase-like protein